MSLIDFLLSAAANQERRSRRELLETLRASGATTPANARSLAELQIAPGGTWTRLVRQGRVREGAPDHFYLFEGARPSRRERTLKLVIGYLLIVLIPLLVVLVRRR